MYIFFVYFKYDKDFKKMKQLFTSAKVFERISLDEIFPEVKLYIFFFVSPQSIIFVTPSVFVFANLIYFHENIKYTKVFMT